MLYPDVDLVADVAAEIFGGGGTPGFADPVVADPDAAQLVHQVHRAAEQGETLAADSLMRGTLAQLLRRHGARLPQRAVHTAGARRAQRARALLEERMASPPTLLGLAAELETSPFALLRAFRELYGMPPHSWLTDARVHRVRALLDGGVPPGEAAVAVGFTDQPHLTRHFSRIVGVPPGAYQRGRARMYKTNGGSAA